jgi:phosphoglycolate phosphatase
MTVWQDADMHFSSAGGIPPPRVLVLWDIDHTLMETRGLGFGLYQRAFKAATGKDMMQLADVSGRTELDIMAETLRINGIEPAVDAIARLAAALIDSYEAAKMEIATHGRALPGAKETLALLSEDTTLYQSVLTGNLMEVARIKLEAFELAQYLDLEAGAYGIDDHNRAELVYRARQRAQTIVGVTFPGNRTVLIGDTPNDVIAGRVTGTPVIGIASGKSNEDELRAAGAAAVLPRLESNLIKNFVMQLTS